MNVRALHDETLSFGTFEFQRRSGRLTKHGHRIKLQPKSAAVLSCLLEQPGEVVSRGQLQERLWPEGHYVDFELGIKVAVKKLRDALGDESADPIYIQTVHGEGYRFIGTLDDLVNHPASEVAALSEGTVALPVAPRSFFASRHALLWTAATMVAIAGAALAFVVPRVRQAASVQFQNRDWIIIVPFENRTGDGLLDGTMEYALERALSQSRYVNVAPRERINDTLTLMRERPDVKLNEDLGRQVAIRDGGIKAVVGGRVEKLGSKYVLSVRLLNPQNGELAALIEKTGSKEGLLDAARAASAEVRQKLGERPLDRETRANLEKATTPSLAALRAFSAGMEQVNLNKWRLAMPLLEEAVVQDPRFATAHIYAAYGYSNLNQPEKAAPHYQAAFQVADSVTQRERLFILGSYYGRFLNDHRRAIDAYTALVGLYPDDYSGAENLRREYELQRTLPEHMDVLEKLDAIRPTPGLTFRVWNFYKFDQPNESKAQQYREKLRRVRQSGVIDPWVDSALDLESVSNKWLRGDMTAAAEELSTLNARAAGQVQAQACDVPGMTIAECNDWYKSLISEAHLVFGRLAAARDLCDHMSSKEAFRHECLFKVAYAAGDRNGGKEQLRQILTSGPTSASSAWMDILLTLWLGEIATAERWSENFAVGDTVRGWLLLDRGRLQEAVDQLRNGAGPRIWNEYVLACALERQGKVNQAISGLEQMRLPPYMHVAWTWPQTRMKLAELYRKTGRVSQAEKVEDELRRYLSAADPDHPLLAQLSTGRAHPSR